MEFLSSSSTPWCGGLHESDVGSVVFPNSGELFGRHCSSLTERTVTMLLFLRFLFVRTPLCAITGRAPGSWPGHRRLHHPPEAPPHRSPGRPTARSCAMLLA
ncbi:uncharacterized protein LOC111256501 [Setaria italica]|uniref:uncharacterized protein LOC111256501 n=1 Tax=Setaria italica TaxID=4555 RepID=UPI000BE58CCB|nr:uncharacterized protein LOC111256501 [Setaria italica]